MRPTSFLSGLTPQPPESRFASVIARDGCNQRLDRALHCLFLAGGHALLVVHVHTGNRCREQTPARHSLTVELSPPKLAGFRPNFLIKPAEQIAFDILLAALAYFA